MATKTSDLRALARAVSVAKAEVVSAAIAYVDAKALPPLGCRIAAFENQSLAVAQYREAIANLEAHTHD